MTRPSAPSWMVDALVIAGVIALITAMLFAGSVIVDGLRVVWELMFP